MTDKKTFNVSVRNLIEICLKQGDLSRGYVSRTRAQKGIAEHTRIQKSRGKDYEKEVSVSLTIEEEMFNLNIFGRIDGVFVKDNQTIIEEIKSCQADPQELSQNPPLLHMAQLKCYGHMLIMEKGLKKVDLLLTYSQVHTQVISEIKKTFFDFELKTFFDALISEYIFILKNQANWTRLRDNSIEHLTFPYDDFREGQRTLAESVYKIIKNKKILFARAPTGTGKTIATLFPAIKSMGLNQIDKIFYLTAKTVGRTVAVKALKDMRNNGLRLKSVVITAKQKICPTSDLTCEMETCSFAVGYYSKLKTALKEIYRYEAFDQALIESLGNTFNICPFELSLDLSLICDVIICDLNYCFDPRVYLKRFFDQTGQSYTFLIDEAHNLPDRLRSMYSAELLKSDVLKTQKLTRDTIPGIAKGLARINKQMLTMKKECIANNSEYLTFDEISEEFLSEIKSFAVKADLWLDRNQDSSLRPELLEFYFNASIFINIATYFDSNYQFFIERIGPNDISVRLFCMDPSPIFSALIKRSRSAVLFSATLTPIDYYQTILFDDNIDPFSIALPSPFPFKNFGLFIYTSIKTTYVQRSHFYTDIAQIILTTIKSKPGNYIIYFPSYEYMEMVLVCFTAETPKEDIIVQTPNMSEDQRQDFINTFKNRGDNTIGFAVMGGIFGEGIDLVGKKLIGSIIVSVGVPQVCPERNLIKHYYDVIDQSGFFKSYQMPGFNRVMQAAGRVIRSQTDTGVVILIDERFTRNDYLPLYPQEWKNYKQITSESMLKERLSDFWSGLETDKN